MTITIMAEDEERYSNRMLDDKFDKQTRDLKEHMELLTRPILEQVLKTNGRTTALEKRAGEHEGWHRNQEGSDKMLMYIMVPILTGLIGYLGWLSAQVLAVPTQIHAAVNDAFAPYEITR